MIKPKLCERSSTESISGSFDSEIGLLTESSTATAQTAQCDVPVAVSSSIGKAPRSNTKNSAKKVCLLESFWISGLQCTVHRVRLRSLFYLQSRETHVTYMNINYVAEQQAICCGQQATCCAQHVACCPQQVARPRNMLRWCKRGIRN